MAFDENPDEVFDNEPEADMGGNGDEQSNRSFRMMMIGLGVIGGLGVLLIALIFISRQNQNSQFLAEQQMVQQTNAAVEALAKITPTPLPTDTPRPTNTAAPTNTPTLAPSPTTAPTQLSPTGGTAVVTGTQSITATTSASTQKTPAGKGTAIAQVQGTAAANATAKPGAGGQATTVPTRVSPQAGTTAVAPSKGVTSTQPISGTTGTGDKGLPTTGAGDDLLVLLLAAAGLVGVAVVARRLRTAQV